MGLLDGKQVYLAGPMEYADDRGRDWRDGIAPILQDMGITVADPCSKEHLFKIFSDAIKADVASETLTELKDNEKWKDYANLMRQIRCMDLRIVDKSDFLIARVSIKVPMAGTVEEIVLANREKKPVLLWTDSDTIGDIPGWYFGMLPWQTFFTAQDEIVAYLSLIDEGCFDEPNRKRWML
jgi:nucleoside 2-deoxyribosyltransferase